MAAGKSLWVKLRYRIRPLSASSTGQALDPTKTGWNIRSSLASPVSHNILDFALPPSDLMDHLPNMIATSIEQPHPASLPTPPMISMATAESLAQRKARKANHMGPKRSLSTPNAKAMANGDSAMTLAEKRRNKLGYHRTSIACSHCRRRKIRCLAAPDDPHQRCANCIRLKKECTFFPVEQQPPVEKRSKNSGAKADRRLSNADPPHFGNPMLDPHDHPNPFQGMPFTSQGFGAVPACSPLTRGSIDLHRQSFDFNAAPHQHPQHWQSTFHETGPMSAGHSSPGDVPPAFWERHTDSPMTPGGYSPHLSTPHSGLNGIDTRTAMASFAPSARNDSTWSAPARSTSVGMMEDFASQYTPKHHSFPQVLPLDLRRRQSDMHPPALLTSGSSHASMSDANLTPLSAPVSSPPDTWGVGGGWGTLPSSAVTKPTDFGNWGYSEPRLANLPEEDVPPPYGEHPAIVYADADPR